MSDLSETDVEKLRSEITRYSVVGDLRRTVNLNIKRLRDMGCYRLIDKAGHALLISVDHIPLLTLSLFVSGVFTNHPDNTLAPHQLTAAAHFSDRRTHFHD